jgi:lysozyme
MTPLLNVVIDISHHNTTTSFKDAFDSGIMGVIHKATEGTSFVDAKYRDRRHRAVAAGLLYGAYHFGVKGNPREQADHFLETADPGDLMVLDFEPNPREGTMSVSEAEEFMAHVVANTGRRPWLYSGQSFLKDQLRRRPDSNLFLSPLWIARYSQRMPEVPVGFATFTLWQYTDGSMGPQPHQVPGIGRCDRNKFNGTEAELRALWGGDSGN